MSPFAQRSVLTLALLAVGCTLSVQNVSRTATSDTALTLSSSVSSSVCRARAPSTSTPKTPA